MKIAIFGGTGFIGQYLVNYFKNEGEEVLAISRSGGGNSLAIDIGKQDQLAEIDFSPDIVVNCASRTPIKGKTSKDPEYLRELFLTNVVGSVNITNWAVEKKAKKLINCSTLVVVKKPWPEPFLEDYIELPDGFHVGYSMSKLSQEQIMNESIKGSATKLVHLRLSAVYGIGMVTEGIIFDLLNQLRKNQNIDLVDGHKNTIDLIHVKDVCKAIHRLSKAQINKKIINVARGEDISIYQLAEVLKRLTNSSSQIFNSNTEKPSSRAKVNIDILNDYSGSEKINFISVEDGLREIVQSE